MPDHPARLAPHGLVLAIALMLAVPSNAWSDNHEVGETAAYTITPDHARPGARLWVQGQCDARRETASIGVARSEDDPNYNWQTDPDFYWRVNYTTSIVDGTFEGPMEVPADAPPRPLPIQPPMRHGRRRGREQRSEPVRGRRPGGHPDQLDRAGTDDLDRTTGDDPAPATVDRGQHPLGSRRRVRAISGHGHHPAYHLAVRRCRPR